MKALLRIVAAALAIELRKAIVGAFTAKPKPPAQETAQPWTGKDVLHVHRTIEKGARRFP